MTDAATIERKTRTKKRGGRFVSDAELIEYLGVPEKIGRQTLKALDGNARMNFPKKQPIWGARRDMEAIKVWLDRMGGIPQVKD